MINGEISTRTASAPGREDTYPAGNTFTANPGEYLELGNATAANARVIGTALLPKVTAGESIHWMDWDRLLPRLSNLLEPGGYLALVGPEREPSCLV